MRAGRWQLAGGGPGANFTASTRRDEIGGAAGRGIAADALSRELVRRVYRQRLSVTFFNQRRDADAPHAAARLLRQHREMHGEVFSTMAQPNSLYCVRVSHNHGIVEVIPVRRSF